MASARRLTLPTRLFVLLDRLVGGWWIFVVCATLPIFLMLLEPVGLLQDGLLKLGGPREVGQVVDSQLVQGSFDNEAVWLTEVALVRDPSQRQVGFSTGSMHAIGEEVSVQCAFFTCRIFQTAGHRSTQLGVGAHLVFGSAALLLALLPLRSLWRRRWWWAALQRGEPTLGWVADDSSSSETVQRLVVHYDDAHDARWQRRCWLGYREGGIRSSNLRVLYLPDAPQRAVVLDELQDWMGSRIPDSGQSWPSPDPAASLRVLLGGGSLLACVLFYLRVLG